jgi:hypothetical protein
MMGFFVIFSFMFWLIDFQQEYLGPDLYLNFYLAGAVNLLAAWANLWLYEQLGLRQLLQIFTGVCLLASVFLIAVQKRWIAFKSADYQTMFVTAAIPFCLLLISLGNQIGYLAI